MNISKGKIAKVTLVFLGLMLLFTVISTKIDYLMTAEVRTIQPGADTLSFRLQAFGRLEGTTAVFSLDLEQEGYMEKGDNVTLKFANFKGSVTAIIQGKDFDEESQSVSVVCKIVNRDQYELYDGQNCTVSFEYPLGHYDIVLPRECVVQTGQGECVYVVESQKGVMGAYEIVRRVPVTVLETDEFNVAVKAPLDTQSLVVQNSTKPLAHEQKVRTD